MYDQLEKALCEKIEGEVHFDLISKQIYSVDASIYEIEPIGIIVPKHTTDLINAVKIAFSLNIPVIARGAATGITGGCIGRGLIIDTSKYLNQILEINYEAEYAICEPGVVQDVLNAVLGNKGYRLGPDTSTGNRATIGGMLANNAAGASSLHYGKMVDHVEEIDLILSNGEIITFNPIDQIGFESKVLLEGIEGNIYRLIQNIRSRLSEEIKKKFPKVPRRVSGYNLDELIKPFPLNVCKVIVGSEGTLGIVSKFKVRICKVPRITGLLVVHFHDVLEGMRAVIPMLAFHPLSLEMIDANIIALGSQSPATKSKLGWLMGSPQAVFVAEFEGSSLEDVTVNIEVFESSMKKQKIGYAYTRMTDPQEMHHIWDVRKAGLGLLMSKRTYSRAIAFIEDISISPEQLATFMEKFISYLKSINKNAGIYGHVGSGCMHIRPFMDLRQESEIQLMKKIMEDVSDLLLEHEGAFSGEHGDGLIRSWMNRKMFGEEIYEIFLKLKYAFDPINLMNPGKIVNGSPLLQDLRTDPNTKISIPSTFLNFDQEGGFHLAIDMCNGNGQCRKKEGVMCPSFQVTGDEYDSTRARAQALREIVNGKRPLEDFTSEGIYQILDLCLECKGCKTECPSQVDMAKIKSEFLFHYQEKHGYSLRSRLFGNIGLINHIGSYFPKLFNICSKNFFAKQVFSWIGITPHREFPQIARLSFSEQFKSLKVVDSSKQVVLFNDTYTQFNYPEIGIAAIQVLNKLDYQVIVPKWHCCGRPQLSKGQLKQAALKAEKLVEILYQYAVQNIPIIGLEPSCILTIKDDFKSVLNKKFLEKIHAIEIMCITFDEFVENHIQNGTLPLNFANQSRNVMVHTHCHQKALVGSKCTLNVLKSVYGLNVSEIDSGCCGLAGSFGYESEHYEFSLKVGNLKLFPAISASSDDMIIVANGISCRSQIMHGTQRRAYHLAEILSLFMQSSV